MILILEFHKRKESISLEGCEMAVSDTFGIAYSRLPIPLCGCEDTMCLNWDGYTSPSPWTGLRDLQSARVMDQLF